MILAQFSQTKKKTGKQKTPANLASPVNLNGFSRKLLTHFLYFFITHSIRHVRPGTHVDIAHRWKSTLNQS